MCKGFAAGCVAVALALASAPPAGAAPGTPDSSRERDPLAFNDDVAPLGIHFQPYANPVGLPGDVGGTSPVDTTLGSAAVADATPAAIPLPAGVYVGLVGLASTFAAWRRFKRRRI